MLIQVYKENDSWMWTGGSNDIRTGYQWSDKSPFVYINWKLGEPNDYMGKLYSLSKDYTSVNLGYKKN